MIAMSYSNTDTSDTSGSPVYLFTTNYTYTTDDTLVYQDDPITMFFDLSIKELKRIINLERCKEILKVDFFKVLKLDLHYPITNFIRRILRCNRKGIGLRFKQ